MTLQEFYAQIGGSYADTVRRLCSESFVLRFVKKYPANPSFDELCEAVDRSDWESAFRAAHTLKGVALNLGLGSLAHASSQMTEALRAVRIRCLKAYSHSMWRCRRSTLPCAARSSSSKSN